MADNTHERYNVDSLIEKIAEIQENADRKYWEIGLFPNFRFHKILGYSRPDNSIFHTASIIFILNEIKENLSAKSQLKVEEISKKVREIYPRYQSITGEKVYNFYPTNPSKHFANGLIFKHFKHFQLPHDSDDTALIYLTKNSTIDENIYLQQKLKQHANGATKEIKNIDKKFQTLKAYSTWFGKKMPIEFDAVVHCNLLYSQLAAGLELDSFGLASWEYIRQSILLDNYIIKPFETSHNYAKPTIITYHIVKLITKFELPDSAEIIKKLAFDLEILFNNFNEISMDKILISSSLYRLGISHKLEYTIEKIEKEINEYSFFFAGLLSSFECKILYQFSKNPLFHLHWKCPAHSLALLSENLVFKQHLQ
jgi:hypothetical protein